MRRPLRRPPLPHLLALAGLGVAALALAACASSGSDERKERARRQILSSHYDDARVGAESSRAVAAEIGVIDHPTLTPWIQSIGRRLLRGVPRRGFDYQFQLVDMTEPNAFALPGGFIFVSRGLLALLNSEDELACVIGHEITHAAARHSAAQQALARSINPLAMPWNRAALMASYGRDMEREADEGGQMLCAAAGYDPLAMSTFLRSLEQFEQLRRGYSRGASFFDTHPTSRERAASNAVRASEIRWQRNPALGDTVESLHQHLEGLAVGQRPEAGVFVDDDFIHPELGFTIRFPRGWTQMNTNQAVGAVAPRGDAVVFLVAGPPGTDPKAVAEAWFAEHREEQRLSLVESKPVKVGALDAWRMRVDASTAAGAVTSYVTFVPYDEATWRITGMARAMSAGKYLGRTLSSSRSFRPIDEADRERIRVTRLHSVRARSGEDLAALSRRTGNAWDIQTLAVYNGVFVNHRFEGGEPVKIVREQAYVARARSDAAGGG